MLEAKFPKISLEKVNQYNLDRKFIRTVSYQNKKRRLHHPGSQHEFPGRRQRQHLCGTSSRCSRKT